MSPEERDAAAKELLARVRALVHPLDDSTIMKGTAAAGLPERLYGKFFNCILEIGTCRGVSAAVFSFYADTVITIDIVGRHEVPYILAIAGAAARVIPVVVDGEPAKNRLIRAATFDMAFIDGNHKAPHVQVDFDLVKKCGCVLFHDYPVSGGGFRGGGECVDAITEGVVERCEPFAWWRAE